MTTRISVVIAQIVLFVGYLVFSVTTEVAPAFSTADWLFLLVPPGLFASLLALGLRLRPAGPTWLRGGNLLGNTLVALRLVGTLLLIPLWVLVPDI